MSEKFYQTDSYQRSWSARIIDRKGFETGYGLVLDKNFFFPGGGGQEPDRGTIAGQALVQIVQEGEQIFHIVEKEISKDEVECVLDWDFRFTMMQQHTGEHILAASFSKLLGAETLSSYLKYDYGRKVVPAGKCNLNHLQEVEDLANQIVEENRAVNSLSLTEGQWSKLPLRKQPHEKFLTSGQIRIIEIEDFDYIPCGGTHCRTTGEVGMIKIVHTERDGEEMIIDFCCGRSARRDYQALNTSALHLGARFSMDRHKIEDGVRALQTSKDELNSELQATREKLSAFTLQSLLARAKKQGEIRIIKQILDASAEELKQLGKQITDQEKTVALLGTNKPKALLLFACSRDLDFDMNKMIMQCAPSIEGSGGGSPFLAQAGGDKTEGLADALDIAVKLVRGN